MIVWLRHVFGWLRSAFCAREDLILENLALRQQLLALHTQLSGVNYSFPSTTIRIPDGYNYLFLSLPCLRCRCCWRGRSGAREGRSGGPASNNGRPTAAPSVGFAAVRRRVPILLGLLHPVARNIQLQDDAVVN